MSVSLAEDGAIILEGNCPIEDAETLLRFLARSPEAPVDLAACDHAHTAVIQILLAARPRLHAPSRDPFLSRWIEPALKSHGIPA